MKLNFKSVALQNNNPVNIEFTTELTREVEGEYDVLSFIEPSRKVANRIEISKKRINIFAGSTTLILKLNEWFGNPFVVSQNGKTQEITFFTFLKELDYDNQLQRYKIVYDLSTSNNLEKAIGHFTIILEIN